MEEAQILLKEHAVLPSRGYFTWHWQGPRTGVAWVSRLIWDRVQLEAPWPLRVVEDKPEYDGVLVARADGLCILSWFYYSAMALGRDFLTSLKSRIILTLMVWGLARVPQNEIPSWSHVGLRRRRHGLA